MLPITAGVPQGSVLGPLLFLLYINDMPLSSKIVNFILFADDTTVFYSSPAISDLFANLSCELPNLNHWFRSNKLLINADKTKLIIFHTYQKERYIHIDKAAHYLVVDNKKIEPSESTRFLGLVLDNKVNFKHHVDFIRLKLLKGIYALKRAAKILKTNDLKLIYSSLILPYLNYGLLIWGGVCKTDSIYKLLDRGSAANHMRTLTPIHKLQKAALRIISRKKHVSMTSPCVTH